MTTNYVLIDFENVQPKNLELLSKQLRLVGAAKDEHLERMLFTKKLEESELTSLIEQLKKLRYITVQEGRVSYKLSR